MYTVKLLGICGVAYLIIGLFNIRSNWGDRFYMHFWGFKPLNNYSTAILGVYLIGMEILADLFINFIL